ncbi:class I SAM-dependent rRNA methyltransferase [Bermanella sp. WJH001]|uniref:class I SAM-dependent rRNA methyltransferase n=1 Tax=Bermanella sp. WJH001 TaxID=3048005 RepID=UPI0024BE3D68|nr:class I SAM-dependent rRNA methyltransferase [Bermanella sp. WJH001]MDJ1539026.1 class I SAM-dependent rRNA methyltransferase [Bermanella sp. WJH001]
MTLPILRLRAKEDKRLRQGHIWIYSNEVDTKATPLKSFTSGEQVIVQSSQGKNLGVAYINPNSLICARLLSRRAKLFGRGQIMQKIEMALALREACFDQPYYRLVYGDSDGLPGLVIDRFGDYFVAQISTAGMEAMKSQIQGALTRIFDIKGLLWKNDGKMRVQEGLEEYVEVAEGEMPKMVPMIENQTQFEVPVWDGQKTGWFYDHRLNRERINRHVKGKRVLDICSYAGGWGVQAATAGAEHVTCVDISKQALDWVEHNAKLNGVENAVSCIQGDAFTVMEKLIEEGQMFDVVILDPPAFIPKRKDIPAGERAYQKLNQQGMRLLGADGFLLSASCSMHLSESSLENMLMQAGRHLDRHVQIIERGSQGPDHPVHPAIHETRYIKSLMCRVAFNV